MVLKVKKIWFREPARFSGSASYSSFDVTRPPHQQLVELSFDTEARMLRVSFISGTALKGEVFGIPAEILGPMQFEMPEKKVDVPEPPAPVKIKPRLSDRDIENMGRDR